MSWNRCLTPSILSKFYDLKYWCIGVKKTNISIETTEYDYSWFHENTKFAIATIQLKWTYALFQKETCIVFIFCSYLSYYCFVIIFWKLLVWGSEGAPFSVGLNIEMTYSRSREWRHFCEAAWNPTPTTFKQIILLN